MAKNKSQQLVAPAAGTSARQAAASTSIPAPALFPTHAAPASTSSPPPVMAEVASSGTTPAAAHDGETLSLSQATGKSESVPGKQGKRKKRKAKKPQVKPEAVDGTVAVTRIDPASVDDTEGKAPATSGVQLETQVSETDDNVTKLLEFLEEATSGYGPVDWVRIRSMTSVHQADSDTTSADFAEEKATTTSGDELAPLPEAKATATSDELTPLPEAKATATSDELAPLPEAKATTTSGDQLAPLPQREPSVKESLAILDAANTRFETAVRAALLGSDNELDVKQRDLEQASADALVGHIKEVVWHSWLHLEWPSKEHATSRKELEKIATIAASDPKMQALVALFMEGKELAHLSVSQSERQSDTDHNSSSNSVPTEAIADAAGGSPRPVEDWHQVVQESLETITATIVKITKPMMQAEAATKAARKTTAELKAFRLVLEPIAHTIQQFNAISIALEPAANAVESK